MCRLLVSGLNFKLKALNYLIAAAPEHPTLPPPGPVLYNHYSIWLTYFWDWFEY